MCIRDSRCCWRSRSSLRSRYSSGNDKPGAAPFRATAHLQACVDHLSEFGDVRDYADQPAVALQIHQGIDRQLECVRVQGSKAFIDEDGFEPGGPRTLLDGLRKTEREGEGGQETLPPGQGDGRAGTARELVENGQVQTRGPSAIVGRPLTDEAVPSAAHAVEPTARCHQNLIQVDPEHPALERDLVPPCLTVGDFGQAAGSLEGGLYPLSRGIQVRQPLRRVVQLAQLRLGDGTDVEQPLEFRLRLIARDLGWFDRYGRGEILHLFFGLLQPTPRLLKLVLVVRQLPGEYSGLFLLEQGGAPFRLVGETQPVQGVGKGGFSETEPLMGSEPGFLCVGSSGLPSDQTLAGIPVLIRHLDEGFLQLRNTGFRLFQTRLESSVPAEM